MSISKVDSGLDLRWPAGWKALCLSGGSEILNLLEETFGASESSFDCKAMSYGSKSNDDSGLDLSLHPVLRVSDADLLDSMEIRLWIA